MDVRRVSAPPGRVQACGWLREPGVVQLALCGRGALRPGEAAPLCRRQTPFMLPAVQSWE